MTVAFPAPVVPHSLSIVFQGGFVARTISVYYDAVLATQVFPQDVNRTQSFDLPTKPARALKLVFQDGSDLFGRITLYDLQLHGTDGTDSG